MRDKANILIAVCLLLMLLVTTLVYWPGLNGPFLLDDFINIESAFVSDFNIEKLYYEVTHNKSGTLGRPVSMLSLLISGILHGPSPWGYKFHNLAIHLNNGLLLFWLLIKILPRLAPGQGRENQLFIATITTAIWLLHPLMVSTVLYAVQRMAQLSALFTIGALLLYVYAREASAKSGPKFYLLAYLAYPFFLLLSIFSKENGVLIPLYIIAMEITVYRLDFFKFRTVPKCWLIYLGIFTVFSVIIGSLYLITHLDQFANFTSRDFNMVERLMTELKVVAVYLKMILVPRLSDMTLFHDYFQVTRTFDFVTALLLILLAGAVAAVFLLRHKAPVFAFAIAWFLVSHSLESSIFNLEIMFEHRNYLAAVGPVLAVVCCLSCFSQAPNLKYLNLPFLALIAAMTFIRVQEWSSEEMIYQIAVTEHPDSARAQTQIANVKFNRGDVTGALEHLSAAQENSPREFGPVLHQVAIMCTTGMDIQPLLEEARYRASRYPVTAYSLNSLDNLLVLLNENRCPELTLDELLSVVESAEGLTLNQSRPRSMGFLLKVKGQIFMLKGDYGKSIEYALAGYDYSGITTILSNLARNLIQLNLLGDAEEIIRILERINNESGGIETALITPLRRDLAEKVSEQELINEQSESGEN